MCDNTEWDFFSCCSKTFSQRFRIQDAHRFFFCCCIIFQFLFCAAAMCRDTRALTFPHPRAATIRNPHVSGNPKVIFYLNSHSIFSVRVPKWGILLRAMGKNKRKKSFFFFFSFSFHSNDGNVTAERYFQFYFKPSTESSSLFCLWLDVEFHSRFSQIAVTFLRNVHTNFMSPRSSLCRAIMWIQSERLLDCGRNFLQEKRRSLNFTLRDAPEIIKESKISLRHGQFSIWIANRSARVDGNGEKFKLKSIEREMRRKEIRKHKNKPVIDAFSALEKSTNLLHRANTIAES